MDAKVDDLKKEEYKSLRTAIDDATRMQVQVFTFSLITATTLLGVILKFGSQSYTSKTIYAFLIPTLITIPCSFLIRNLRTDIYRTATYIQVFIEEESPFRYEGALSVIRDKFHSKESFDPIFSAYWIFILSCAGLFVLTALEANIPLELWQAIPWLTSALLLGRAHWQYQYIPNVRRRLMLDQWRSIRSTSSLQSAAENVLSGN